MNALKDMFTGKDNQTYNLMRVGVALGLLTYLALCTWDVVHNHRAFQMQDFGIGLGAVLGASGAAIKLQGQTEPGA